MSDFLAELRRHMDTVEQIGNEIENQEIYIEDLKKYLPSLNQMVLTIFGLTENTENSLELNKEFVLQVLNDIIYGIEQEDSVFLLDVLRYGLLEIYAYIEAELQGRNIYE